jgi:hypothetical protein
MYQHPAVQDQRTAALRQPVQLMATQHYNIKYASKL